MDDCTTKRCCRCKLSYPADTYHFHRNAHYSDGLHAECIWCREEQRPKSKRLAPIPVLYNGNEKRCTFCQEWLPATPDYFDKTINRVDGFHPRCKECRATEKKLDSLNNGNRPRSAKAKRNAVQRTQEWVKNHPDRARRSRRAVTLRYRARKKKLDNSFTPDHWDYCLEWFNDCCAYCGSQRDFWHNLEADHFIPLSLKHCPGTVPSNIVPACRLCNASKSDLNTTEWLVSRFGKRRAKIILARIEGYFASLPHE